ncbi:LacI family DNA-binding transcriptional regulator [Nocardioides iriomotensis]|uniref:LacI family DNA-binding transcriptional regulator n=2 Tax=Nocardioides iriomotensis TaxID=715784 RepID=A0A4Q5J3N6_9ACTN|nr:LacI family DNA-binding transcriptional regulator [Nocardioides iriomotensis]
MDDLARHLGLSRATVSFALNGRTDVRISEATRARVVAAARELGYRPHAGAQSLAAQRTDLIGFVTDIPASPFGGGIIHGAQAAAWRRHKLLLIVSSEGDPEIEATGVEMLLDRRVEGLVYATQMHRVATLPAAVEAVPTVLVHCTSDRPGAVSVLPDEVEGGYAATRRLLAAGHRRIGLVNLAAGLPASTGRRSGYERALTEAGLELEPALVRQGDATATTGYDLAARLLDLADPPTGLFCATDRMAMGAYDAAKERGLRIPEDVAVVGFDNQEIVAAYLRPALTTVALPFAEMGVAAVEMLAATAAGERVLDRTLTGRLVERASV